MVSIAVVGAAAETATHAASSIAGRYSSRTSPAVSSCFIATSAQNEWRSSSFASELMTVDIVLSAP